MRFFVTLLKNEIKPQTLKPKRKMGQTFITAQRYFGHRRIVSVPRIRTPLARQWASTNPLTDVIGADTAEQRSPLGRHRHAYESKRKKKIDFKRKQKLPIGVMKVLTRFSAGTTAAYSDFQKHGKMTTTLGRRLMSSGMINPTG